MGHILAVCFPHAVSYGEDGRKARGQQHHRATSEALPWGLDSHKHGGKRKQTVSRLLSVFWSGSRIFCYRCPWQIQCWQYGGTPRGKALTLHRKAASVFRCSFNTRGMSSILIPSSLVATEMDSLALSVWVPGGGWKWDSSPFPWRSCWEAVALTWNRLPFASFCREPAWSFQGRLIFISPQTSLAFSLSRSEF